MARNQPVMPVSRFRLATLAGVQLRYTGQRLNQRDADVFLHLLARAHRMPPGAPVRFTAHALLVDLGWDRNARGYARLRDAIAKLRAGAIECEWLTGPGVHLRYAGALISAFARRHAGGDRTLRRWTVRLDPKLTALLDPSSYAPVHLRARRALRNHELAKWLYACLVTHRDGVCTMRTTAIRALSGSTAKTLSGFRRTLRQALDVLVGQRLVERYVLDPDRDRVWFCRALPVDRGAPVGAPPPQTPVVSPGTRHSAHAARPHAERGRT